MGRKLTDLYKVGKEILINDDSGEEPIRVYLRKLSPLDQEKALKRANAARAALLAKRNVEDSEEFQSRSADVQQFSREDKIGALIGEELGKIRQLRESELEHEEEGEWAKDGYLQGLKDSWDETMSQRYAEDPEDPEAKGVFEELKRFNEAVNKIMESEEHFLRVDHESTPDSVLDLQMTKKLLELEADGLWLREFRRAEVWLSVRNPEDIKQPYFESREEVDELDPKVFLRLTQEYQALLVDPGTGKDSEAQPPSSDSSEAQETVETPEASGLLSVVQ